MDTAICPEYGGAVSGPRPCTRGRKNPSVNKKQKGEKIMANKTVVTAEPDKQELFITREFDAPRELVFKAHTDPDQYVQWVGPSDLEMTVQKLDAVDGGTFEFTHKRGGHAYRFFGTYHEVA